MILLRLAWVWNHWEPTDVVSLFKDEPEILIEKLLTFCKLTIFSITLISPITEK